MIVVIVIVIVIVINIIDTIINNVIIIVIMITTLSNVDVTLFLIDSIQLGLAVNKIIVAYKFTGIYGK